jgi:hypothetical protein
MTIFTPISQFRKQIDVFNDCRLICICIEFIYRVNKVNIEVMVKSNEDRSKQLIKYHQ